MELPTVSRCTPGDLLVVDLPSIRITANRGSHGPRTAGEKLLGICVFHLLRVTIPTLTADQVHTHSTDRDANAVVDVRIRHEQTDYAHRFQLPEKPLRVSPAN